MNKNFSEPYRFGASQSVAYTGTAGQSSAISDQIRVVRILSSSDCFVLVGVNPTATSSDAILVAANTEYISVRPGEKISAIQSSAGGTLFITECTR